VIRPLPRPRNLVRLEKESSVRETEPTHRRPIPKPRRRGNEIHQKQVVEESHIEEVPVEEESEDESESDMECTVVYPRERLTGQDRDRGKEIQGQEDMQRREEEREAIQRPEDVHRREEESEPTEEIQRPEDVQRREEESEPTEEIQRSEVTVRKSARVKTKPVWFDAYIVGQQQIGKLIEMHLENSRS